MIYDLRSDTFTKPTAAMRSAMAAAEVGDDVFREDPTVRLLEEKVAAWIGSEAALFCPTATMSNQIAMKVLTQPMDEIICDRLAHIYNYEVGGYAFLSGCSIRYIEGPRGLLTAEQVVAEINPIDVHKPITKLVCLENTCNKGGGSIYPTHQWKLVSQASKQHGLNVHLDGSRLWNAVAATGDNPTEYGSHFDTITLCLSKGLGCPAGSLLCGSQKTIEAARRIRKVLGGGMRQAGIIAAAGIYAIDNHLARLKEDHEMAQALATLLIPQKFIERCLPVETNIVIATLKQPYLAEAFVQHLQRYHIRCFEIGNNSVRLVTHLDVDASLLSIWEQVLDDFLA